MEAELLLETVAIGCSLVASLWRRRDAGARRRRKATKARSSRQAGNATRKARAPFRNRDGASTLRAQRPRPASVEGKGNG